MSRARLSLELALALGLAAGSAQADTVVDPAAFRSLAVQRVATLTPRQREILDLITTGHPSKNIAADLGISQRTVENHRASIMKKTGVKSLPALARMALAATWTGTGEPIAS